MSDLKSANGFHYPSSRWKAEIHPRESEVSAEVNGYFLQHWPFPNEKARKKFIAAGFPHVLEDMSLEDGKAYNAKLMPISRGDVRPDRGVPVEYITWDLWESMRAYDRKMADDILEPTFEFMRAQTDPSRLKPMDLKEYLEYREADVGKALLAALMRFSMALRVSPEDLAIARPVDRNCSRHLSVMNDIWSFEKEVIASQSGHSEGGILCSAVSTLHDAADIPIEASKPDWLNSFECLLYCAGTISYNLILHPLAGFPGPLLARSSLLWRNWSTLSGRHHRHIERLHRKYGAVVRVSPKELSFASVESYEDIYGLPRAGRQHFVKSDFYDIYGSAYKTGCIGSERDPGTHAQKKRNLAAAFTARALAAQEDIVQQYLDTFVEKIGPLSTKNAKGLNITKWFEMATFDILGEMAFGESFGCLAEEKHHFWIDLILDHLYEITLVDNLRRFWLPKLLGRLILPALIMPVREKHSTYSREKVRMRLESSSQRNDFFTNIAAKVKSGDVSLEEMTAHASTLIVAGAETTATELAAATYYVLKTPGVKNELEQEIRSRYASYDELDASSAQQLPYLRAVINETLRIHPSGAHGFPRVSPGATVDGKWIPRGAEVYTNTWTVSHSPKYFSNPDEFDPSRWIEPDCRNIKEASQPFSLGARACLGRNFAYSEMSSCLAKMFFTYDMELVDKTLDWEAASRHYIMWWKAPIFKGAASRVDLATFAVPRDPHHIWSEACVLDPSCVFEPRATRDLSAGLLLIREAQSKFAVRAGGHMPVPGAQSVDGGVMVSLSRLATVALGANGTVAHLGPGNRWGDVYSFLARRGLAVNGGRFPTVGVGGVLVGGGIGYFSGRHGWSCDGVVSYEVVLADGRVVYATADGEHADLFWALKGGHNHFGIVTRFDVRTFPVGAAFGGVATWRGPEAGAAFYTALDAYMAPGGGVDDPDVHISTFVGVAPANGSSSITYSSLMSYPGSDPNPVPLINFTSLLDPAWNDAVVSSGVGVHEDWTEISTQLAAFGTDGFRDLFATFGYIGDPGANRLFNKTVIEGALQNLSHIEGLTVYAAHQPISKGFMEASRRAAPGGNVLGLDPDVDGTFIAARIDAIWTCEEDDEAIYNFVHECMDIMERKLRPLGLWTGFVYLNDAAKGQKPFETYAQGNNLPRLRKIQSKYDPDCFIQDYLQHGFALD
ncbi:hypothetical protein DL765_006903 [Monosporascus sp. GIB2]|nr:hypothetical protein DL765_006903 [Monosporascus sp. GIB2]